MKLKYYALSLLFALVRTGTARAQAPANPAMHYEAARETLAGMLQGKSPRSFKNAVFTVENAFRDAQLDAGDFEKQVDALVVLCTGFYENNRLTQYSFSDKESVEKAGAIFKVMADTTQIITNAGRQYDHLPFVYDFEDVFGIKDWSKMFVSKLLDTHKGNCHSLPYLYKILSDELGIPCHLALAPNHIYVKMRAQKAGWYNTELTSGAFPVDAWLMASGYISLEAIQNGIYLDTLSETEHIALCMLDLGQGFDRKFPDNDGQFVIDCCRRCLQYFPDCINAMMLLAETHLRLLKQMQQRYGYTYLKEVTAYADGKARWDEMNALYGKMLKLGYRQMPEKMYLDWVLSLRVEREKYANKKMGSLR